MFKFIAYLKSHKNKSLKREFRRDEEGNPLVEVEIRERSEVIAPYKVDGKFSINSDFANILDNLGKSLTPKDNLHFNLKCKGWKQEEKQQLAGAIKHYFFNSLIETERKMKSNIKIFWIMIACSLLFVAGLFVADYFGAPFIVTEVIDIITWGFVWEAVDLIAFQRKLFQYEFDHDRVIYNMKITFD